MTSEKPQYDAKVGGKVILDTHVSTFRYASEAVKEMKVLLEDIQSSKTAGTKLIFQSLPKQMRRRAMSHHPKRLPRKYRQIHISQMAKSGKPMQIKRPTRKYRRRPRNLMKDYIRRMRKHVWLETHIWHAKRFHMIDRWGYRLPFVSCDKTYRACYRATANHCLLQDISYFICIELKGSVKEIERGFKLLTSDKCGLSITAKTYLTGRREGEVLLFRAEKYPYEAIGKINFMWRPKEGCENQDDDCRTLWLWLHPSIYTVALIEILKVFNLKSGKGVRIPIEDDDVWMRDQEALKSLEINKKPETNHVSKGKGKKPKLNTKFQSRLKFMTKTLAYERFKRYRNDETGLVLTELKDCLNRFRLWGPLSQAVLSAAFRIKEESKEKRKGTWFHELLQTNASFREIHAKQSSYWKKCLLLNSPSNLLSNFILSLNIEDPRIHRPTRRIKAKPLDLEEEDCEKDFDLSELLMEAEPSLSQSPIWEMSIRDRLCSDMLSYQQYCEKRAKKATVPGKTYQFEIDLQPIPVMLIQRPGSQNPQYKRLGYGCGWDIIAPPGYGMAIWLALIMWGARAGGLRESDTIAREMGCELHLPDEFAGRKLAAEHYYELKSKYFRLPPNRRHNYRRLSIASPFKAPFSQLIRDWQDQKQQSLLNYKPLNGSKESPMNTFYIVRDKSLLQALNLFMLNKAAFPKSLENQNCLLQIKLKMKTRGNPDEFSLICIPSKEDFKRNLKLMKHNNNQPIYIEPLLNDPDERNRKNLRLEHKKLLKRLRAQRVREKRILQEKSLRRVHIRNANTCHIKTAYALKMQSLWLPEDFDTLFTIRKQCTRDVFGYVTSSSFSFTEATCCAIGYITLEGLKEVLSLNHSVHLKQPTCLIRATKSRNYRFATFQLNLNV